MIVKFGVMVVGARGTIGGATFSANKSGPYARAWSKGANPKSTLQSSQRGGLGDLAASWRDLTQVQRDDWITYAALPAQDLINSLGETYSISGFNWYVKINLALEAAGEARRVDAPTLTRPSAPIFDAGVELFITSGSTDTRVRYDATTPDITFNHTVFARIAGQGRSALASNFAFQIIGVPNVARRIFFQDELEAAFGTIALGQRMFVHSSAQDSHGQRSPIDSTFVDAQA